MNKNCLFIRLLLLSVISLNALLQPFYYSHLNNYSLTASAQSADEQSWIAFIGTDQNIWLVHPDGSGAKQVTTDASDQISYLNLNWSPDGQMLAYTRRNRTGQSSLSIAVQLFFVSDSRLTDLVTHSAGGFDWLPDSQILAYDQQATYSQNERGCNSVLQSFQGLTKINVQTKETGDFLLPKDQPLFSPSISSTGSDVILRFDQYPTMYQGGPYYVSKVEPGSESHPLANSYASCTWSKDGSTIACDTWSESCMMRESSECPITLYSPSGEILATVPKTAELYDLSPLWSPDNQSIAINVTDGYFFADGPCIGGSGPDVVGSVNYVDVIHVADLTRRRLIDGILDDWSPDGNSLLILTRPNGNNPSSGPYNQITIVNASTGEIGQTIAEGTEAKWQPGEVAAPLPLEEWITRKQTAIDDIKTPEYEWLLGLKTNANLPVMDESGAEKLLLQLRQKMNSIEPEHAEAFYRLILQEEAIAQIQNDFEKITDDEGEVWSDLFNLAFYSFQILNHHELGLHWLRSALEDSTNMITLRLADLEDRENTRNYSSLITSYVFNGTDIGGYVDDYGIELAFRLIITNVNDRKFIAQLQPTVDQGIHSVNGLTGPVWTVSGKQKNAEDTMKYLKDISKIFYETGHQNYLQTREGLNVAEAMIRLGDLAGKAGEGILPIQIIRIWTYIQYLLANYWALSMNIAPVKECSLKTALAAGEQSFNPSVQTVPDCKFPDPIGDLSQKLSKITQYVDGTAWGNFLTNYKVVLSQYSDVVKKIQDEIQTGKAPSTLSLTNLDLVLPSLENRIREGFALVSPPDGNSWDGQTIAAAQNMVELESQTALMLYILDIPTETLQESETKTAVLASLGSLEASIQKNQEDLSKLVFEENSAGVGVVQPASNPMYVEAGEEIQFTFSMKNVGSGDLEAGELRTNLQGYQVSAVLATVPLRSGEEKQYAITIPAPKSLPDTIEVSFQASGRESTESVQVFLKAQNAPTPTNANLKLIGGIIGTAGGGILLLIGAVLLISRRRGARAKQGEVSQ